MKAITVKQPWASLIVEGIKDIENRTWKTNFRGRVLVHAGMAKTSGLMARYLSYDQHIEFRKKVGYSGLDFLEPLGCIIGSVEIVDCVINHPSILAEKTINKTYWKDGKNYIEKVKPIYNWVLSNPIKFKKPISAKGKLSFWESEINLCHICGQPAEYICCDCDKYFCDDCGATYNQFTQIDYDCCKACEQNINSKI